jgi:hypothetical protein
MIGRASASYAQQNLDTMLSAIRDQAQRSDSSTIAAHRQRVLLCLEILEKIARDIIGRGTQALLGLWWTYITRQVTFAYTVKVPYPNAAACDSSGRSPNIVRYAPTAPRAPSYIASGEALVACGS